MISDGDGEKLSDSGYILSNKIGWEIRYEVWKKKRNWYSLTDEWIETKVKYSETHRSRE